MKHKKSTEGHKGQSLEGRSRFYNYLDSFVIHKREKLQAQLGEQGYAEFLDTYKHWAKNYILTNIARVIGLSITLGFMVGAQSVVGVILIWTVLTTVGLFTWGKSDDIMVAIASFTFAFIALNWFFDDWKKTFSLPLAYCLYRFGKTACPDFLQRILSRIEKLFPFTQTADSVLRNIADEVSPPKQESKKPRPPRRKIVAAKRRKDNSHSLGFRGRPHTKKNIYIGK